MGGEPCKQAIRCGLRRPCFGAIERTHLSLSRLREKRYCPMRDSTSVRDRYDPGFDYGLKTEHPYLRPAVKTCESAC